MQVFEIGGYKILKAIETADIKKFKVELSKLVLSKYGQPPYPTVTTTEILLFCNDKYIKEFEKILVDEKSYSFYKEVVWLHEQAAGLRQSSYFNDFPKETPKSYIAVYRRILKLIIEQGCCVEMFVGEKRDKRFEMRIHPILSKLFHVGEMLIVISELIAEQDMIEEAADVSFNQGNMLVFGRKHHYQFVLNKIAYKRDSEISEYIVDENGEQDFEKAILDSFKIKYTEIKQNIEALKEQFNFKDGDCISAEQSGFLRDLEQLIGVPIKSIEKFLSGLTLTKENKISVKNFLKKPHSQNKYLYRPFLLWTINHKKFLVFGSASLEEAERMLITDAIPFGKMPDEWKDVLSFTEYVNRKEDKHDKWLDDKVEESIKSVGLLYQPHVKKLVTNEESITLVTKDLGEIDFLILSPKTRKIFVAECKHLVGRLRCVENDGQRSCLGFVKIVVVFVVHGTLIIE